MVTKELKTFFETTSVKGVPRVVKSSTRALRINWFIVVVISLSLAAWQSTVLLTEYWQYPTVTVMNEYTYIGRKQVRGM